MIEFFYGEARNYVAVENVSYNRAVDLIEELEAVLLFVEARALAASAAPGARRTSRRFSSSGRPRPIR